MLETPEWAYFPHVGSRLVFLILIFFLLMLQLSVEVYGRTVFNDDDDEPAGARRTAPSGEAPLADATEMVEVGVVRR